MTLQEYQQRDLELQAEIAGYRDASAGFNIQIAANERRIINLEWKRTQLRSKYASNPEGCEMPELKKH